MVEFLIEEGADIEAETVLGQTPLFWAAGRGHVAATQQLLASHACVNSTDQNGDTPLHR